VSGGVHILFYFNIVHETQQDALYQEKTFILFSISSRHLSCFLTSGNGL